MVVCRLVCFLFLMLFAGTSADAHNLSPVGVWQDPSERVLVKIYFCGECLCGNLVWFRQPDDDQGLPLVDTKNMDSKLRTRPLLGLRIIQGLHLAEDGIWAGGQAYNPDDGEKYHAKMWVEEDGLLHVRLYDLLPLFGETQIWTRVR